MKHYHVIIIVVMLLVLPMTHTHIRAQAEREIELTAQEILARVDRIMDYPDGILKGYLMHITPDGSAQKLQITGYINKNQFLFDIVKPTRGSMQKVLYRIGGEDLWVYDMAARALFHKMGIDKYDDILATNFYYVDLSNADLQSNYVARIDGSVILKNNDCFKLTLDPIDKTGAYGKLTLYVIKKSYIPLRIDFHDQDKVIFKTLSIAKIAQKDGRSFPVRYDMLNIKKGTMTVMEFTSIEDGVPINAELFRPEKLGD
ncbi:MAG: outer membrane lipoprotein-sorting protein [Spirochaetes bacterium]|nr:outer membrane lipoprotein-sorting protein [Spirochaetota bacterium]